MKSYLFLFSIAPVQSFISQARKTRDLFAGSKILSKLITLGMKELPSNEFIIPNESTDSNPNRFIAIIKAGNDKEVKDIGDNVTTSVQNEFKQFAADAFDMLGKKDKPNNFDVQIKTHLQIHWVALPYDEKKYKENFKEIESTLGAIKNVRVFEQIDETGRKCSLCGERNALVFNSGDPKAEDEIPNTNLKKRYFTKDSINVNGISGLKYSLIEGEGLCAVCFTKRYYEIEPFPSTAKVALMDAISKLENDKNGNEFIKKYKKLFSDDFDEQLYYQENLTKKYFGKQNIKKVQPDSASEVLEKIKDIAKKINLKLSKYYAVVMFDGDSMGKWLSGVNCKDEETLLEFHRKLSNKLGEFAEKAKSIVIEPKGKIVFAGGEDFLGFVNLNYLFEVLKTLREEFETLVNQGIKDYKNHNANLSFSAGVVIVHYKMPLSEVLKWARISERDAKKINDDKNAFDIAVLKQSGEISKAQFKWGYEKDMTINLDIINELAGKLKNSVYSNTFIKSLDTEFVRLIIKDSKLSNDLMLKSEIKRLVKNSCMIQKKDGEKSEDFKKRKKAETDSFSEKLFALYSKSKSTDNFLSALYIAEFISRHLNKEVENEN